MRTYKVRISLAARADMVELRKFLKAMMTEEGAVRYANNMRTEVKTLAVYAECYGRSTSATLRKIHPEARRMVSCLNYVESRLSSRNSSLATDQGTHRRNKYHNLPTVGRRVKT